MTKQKYDYMIIGAGFAGSVIAERIATVLDKKVLVIDKRDHIGGNCYDCCDNAGILIQPYGPHIFHTNIKHVWDYISQFTEWINYNHTVIGEIDDLLVPIPFNLYTLYQLYQKDTAQSIEKKLIEKYGFGSKVSILTLKDSPDEELRDLAEFVYDKIFLNYTIKQWNLKPEQLDPEVVGRVPVFISKDNRYFQDPYQGMPEKGYTQIFKKMLTHPNIDIRPNTDFIDIIKRDNKEKSIKYEEEEFQGTLIFTGCIDEFFGFCFGELPYRSLRFEFETHDIKLFQQNAVINYPNNHEYTRITEFKHMTKQQSDKTTIVKEYPQSYKREEPGKDIPYYPIPIKKNIELYEKYKNEAEQYKNVIFIGRLAEYKYYNMDLVIDRALRIFEKIKQNNSDNKTE